MPVSEGTEADGWGLGWVGAREALRKMRRHNQLQDEGVGNRASGGSAPAVKCSSTTLTCCIDAAKHFVQLDKSHHVIMYCCCFYAQ